ncbi:MAG TPA: ABC transporter permease [Blastocatellia bacterium]|nr:ABC transporter permease [Blastocatellia bacterium]
METLWRDLRYGARMLRKNYGFTLIAVVSLALGIGANTAIFSLVNAALLRPLPVKEPEQIVSLNNTARYRTFQTFSYPNYKDFRDRNEVFSGLFAHRFAPLSLSHDGINERLWGFLVTGNYFEVLGVKPALGRLISTDDDISRGGHPVTVISYRCWQERFGGQPDAVGRDVLVNGRSYTIIGVAQEGFSGTEVIAAPEMWFPMAMHPQIEVGSEWLDDRGVDFLNIQGRLRPGVSITEAQTAMAAIASELKREHPTVNESMQVRVSAPGLVGGPFRGAVLGFTGLLMAAVGLVLLLACTNLANLLLARAAERRKEIAVRLAMGSDRARLVRQLLTESLVLAIGGGALGLLLALWLVDLAVAFKPPIDIPLAIELPIDHRVLIFNCAVSVVTGVLFGLLPALQATKTDLVTALKDELASGDSRRSWVKSGLIVLQVALSLVLLIGGGLMLRGLQRAETIDLGFDPRGAIEVSFDLRLQGYDNARGREFQKQLLERVRALPGVEPAGLADMVPVDLHFSRAPVFIEGQAPERAVNAPRAMTSRVSPGYFQAMGTRLIRGRDFTERDDENATRVAIINEAFARRFWPGEDPIGKRFSSGSAESAKLQVIGVTENGLYAGLNEDGTPAFYRPMWQSYSGSTYVIARGDTDPQRLIASVRNEVSRLDPNMPIGTARTLAEKLSVPMLPARLAASVLGSFGLLALGLAAIGIYGVMSYAVSRRRREMGIRMALGAQASDVLKVVLGEGMALVGAGVAIGLMASFALTRVMASLLFGVSATDPSVFALVTLLLVSVAFLACYLPARRATRVDPMVALRHE